jgi:hypothetical protein
MRLKMQERSKNMQFEHNAKIRLILRESEDGKIRVCEDTNADYVVFSDDKIVGVYRHKSSAYRHFGILTNQ